MTSSSRKTRDRSGRLRRARVIRTDHSEIWREGRFSLSRFKAKTKELREVEEIYSLKISDAPIQTKLIFTAF